MKKFILTALLIILVVSIYAQPPQAFKYQAVVRGNTGEILQNQEVGIRISIHDITAGGTIVYQETFTDTTNQFGLVNLEIGTGTPTIGTFTGIDWGSDSKFIETEIDPTGSTSYVSIGTSELLAVPYALYSDRSKNAPWEKSGDEIYYNDGDVGIGTSNPLTELHIKKTTLSGEVMRIESENLDNWNSIYNSNGYIGYFGTYNGDNDIDFGTGTGNSLGKVHLVTQATPKLTIDANGNVGIGTTNPYCTLDINGAINTSNAGDDGVSVYYAGHDGVYVNSASHNGVVSVNSGGNGVSVYTSHDDGVYSDAYGYHLYWGFYTEDQTYSQGGYYPAKSGTFAKNIGQNTLEPGDLVCITGGYEENVLGEECVPVVNIAKANSKNSKAIFGVVESQVYIREKTEVMEDGETQMQKSFRFSDEIIKPGDYLSVIVFGIADVKVNPGEMIKSGEVLTAGDGVARKVQTREIEGITVAENTGILGKALEDSKGKDKIKVFVNCK